MKKVLFLLLVMGSVCGLATPQSITLEPLQLYKWSITNRFSDGQGTYDSNGNWKESSVTRSWVVGIGGSTRLAPTVDAYIQIPTVQKTSPTGVQSGNLALGDISAGLHLTLVDSLFDEDWQPRVSLSAGAKFASGSVDSVNRQGRVVSGSGDGRNEAVVQLELEKSWEDLLGSLRLGVRKGFTKSHRVSESLQIQQFDYPLAGQVDGYLNYLLESQWSVGGGLWMRWEGRTQSAGLLVREPGYALGASLDLTYFPSEYWGLNLGLDRSIPATGFGKNSEGLQSVALSLIYSGF